MNSTSGRSNNTRNKQWVTLDNTLFLALFIITFFPLLYTGYLTQDDVERHLTVLSHACMAGARGMAESSGRITLFFHFLLTYVPYLVDAYVYRKIFLILPHVMVVVLFALTLYKFTKNKSVAFVFCILFCAFFTNSWEHNLYGSYPFAFHASMILMILSVILLHKYLESLQRNNLFLSIALYSVVLFTYEQFVVYLSFIIGMIFFSFNQRNRSVKFYIVTTLPYLISTIFFISIVFLFRYFYPNNYNGTTFAAFDVFKFLKTFKTFVFSSFPLYVPFAYVDRIDHGTATKFNYSISGILANLHYIWVVKAFIVSTLLVRMLSVSDNGSAKGVKWYQIITIFLLLVASVLLISLSAKYQEWVVNHMVLAYSSSSYVAQLCAAAFIALLLSLARTRQLLRKSTAVVFYVVVVAIISYVVLVTEKNNFDVLAEQKNSRNKWLAIDSLYKKGVLTDIPNGSLIYAPDFVNTGGIVRVREGYWSSFLWHKYGLDLNITDSLQLLNDPEYLNKKFELSYTSLYPNDKYSVYLGKVLSDDIFIQIPEYELTGFYAIEYDGNGNPFRWSKNKSSLIVCNSTGEDVEFVFTAIIRTDSERKQPLSVCFQKRCNEYQLGPFQAKIKEQYILSPGCQSVKFNTDAVAVQAQDDSRLLYFTISDYFVKPAVP